jgi:hypothetical protein
MLAAYFDYLKINTSDFDYDLIKTTNLPRTEELEGISYLPRSLITATDLFLLSLSSKVHLQLKRESKLKFLHKIGAFARQNQVSIDDVLAFVLGEKERDSFMEIEELFSANPEFIQAIADITQETERIQSDCELFLVRVLLWYRSGLCELAPSEIQLIYCQDIITNANQSK